MSVRDPELRLARAAERDLEEIAIYTGRIWGGAQHAKYRIAIDRAFTMLRDHPRIGRLRDDLFPGCRSVQVEQHVIYYDLPDDTTIFVRRILHARRDASAALRDPGP